MLYTLTEIQNYFTPFGYTIEPSNGHISFFKDGNYVSIHLSNLSGTLEQMKTEVENRFEAGRLYAASQTE